MIFPWPKTILFVYEHHNFLLQQKTIKTLSCEVIRMYSKSCIIDHKWDNHFVE